MFRICTIKCMAIVGVAVLAATLDAAKPPKTPPPPNPAGVLYFKRADQVWQMNGDGSEKKAALPPTFTDPKNSSIERPAIGRPSSCLYNGLRWWLYPQDMDGDELTYDSELWAFCSNTSREIVGHVQLTDLTPVGLSVPRDFSRIQWSNDGEDSFCSVLVGDPTETYPRWYLWKFDTEPALFGSPIYPMMTLLDGEQVINEDDHAAEGHPSSKYSWHPTGNQIAYWDLPAKMLRIRTLLPDVPDDYVPLNLHDVQDMTNLSWSPDGQWIIFFAWTKDSKGAYLNAWWTVRPDGSSLTMLNSSGSPSTLGASKKWSLDSEWVTYEADAGSKIFIIKPDRTAGPYDLMSDLKVTGKSPEQRRLLDWVSKEDAILP